ncbi:MAG: amidohydrolase family protein, partial [Candidatus Heimdallarchaeota archaeon]
MSSKNSKDIVPDTVIKHANELVTMNSKFGVPRIGKAMKELAIINDGALAIKDGKIVFVGTTEELMKTVKIDEKTIQIDATNELVTPGFVDPHVHLIFAGSRENELTMKLAGKTYLEILEAGGGILKTVRETRKATIEELVENGKNILDKMLKHGTTTVEAKSGYGLSTKDEIKSLEAVRVLDKQHPIDLVPTFLGAHAIPPEY